MKTKNWTIILILIILGVAVFVVTVLRTADRFPTQSAMTPSLPSVPTMVGWKTFDVGKFKMNAPANWVQAFAGVSDSYWRFQENAGTLHGSAVPSDGSMWVDISEGGNCVPSDYVPDFKPDIFTKTVCQNGYAIYLQIFQGDPQANQHKQILDQILSTFKSY